MPQNSQKSPKSKTLGEKVIDILHSVTGTGGEDKEDPISGVIKKASDTSTIGGGRRKKMIDEELEKSGG
jgi:hypothetical protein